MLITYLRSSSYSTFDFCQFQFYLRYVLGFEEDGNLKAALGTCAHKALELLARRKLATQRGETTLVDDELGKTYPIDWLIPTNAVNESWNYFSKVKAAQFEWVPRDLAQIYRWVDTAITFNDGMFSPLKRDIVKAEQFFDFEVDEPWASLPTGGRLSLRGTIDLITRVDDKTLEVIDWKTGKPRFDWAKETTKEYGDLRNDPQLRLYHYAMTKLYPDIENIFITIFYLREGAFSLPFSRADLPDTKSMIRKRFEEIRDCELPKRILPSWKCQKLCHYFKTALPGSNKNKCNHVYDELTELGIDKVTAKYRNSEAVNAYEGGGRSK